MAQSTAVPHAASDILLFAQSAGIEALAVGAASRVSAVTTVHWSQVNVGAALDRPWRVALVDLAPSRFAEALAIAQLARTRRASAAIVGLASDANDRDAVIMAATAVRFTDVVLVDAEDPAGMVRAHLLDKSGTGARAAALRTAYASLPDTFHPLARGVLLWRSGKRTLEALGARLGVGRRTIQRDTTAQLGMTMGTIAAWCCVLHGVALLERANWTVKAVAKTVGFGPAQSFRNATDRFLDKQPHELQIEGSTEYAGQRLREWLGRAIPTQPRRRGRRYMTPSTPT